MAFLNHLKPKVFQYRAPALFKISGSVPETYHSACQAILITSQIGFDIASTKVETTSEQDQVETTFRYFFSGIYNIQFTQEHKTYNHQVPYKYMCAWGKKLGNNVFL